MSKTVNQKIIEDGLISKLVYYKAYSSIFARFDVWPFLLSYVIFGILLVVYIEPYDNNRTDNNKNDVMIYIGLIGWPISLVIQLFLFLLSQWSIKMRCLLGYQIVSDIDQAHYIHVTAAKNAGKDRLQAIDRLPYLSTPNSSINVQIMNREYSITKERLDFQKVTYNYNYHKKMFMRLDYPTNASIKNYLTWKGHATMNHVNICLVRWGANEFDIPIPNFLDLYLDHLVAPFFVFQVLCLFLWSLDDYWYYSAFTLLMLMFFEGMMMCKQRQSTLIMLYRYTNLF